MIARFVMCCLMFIAFVANASEPSSLTLPSGRQVTVLSIEKTTLHQSDEPALVLKYQTGKSFDNMNFVAAEVEEVWVAFRPIAEKQGFSAAVVVASEPPATFGLVKSAGWVWKKGADGKWHRPSEGDHALVPKN